MEHRRLLDTLVLAAVALLVGMALSIAARLVTGPLPVVGAGVAEPCACATSGR